MVPGGHSDAMPRANRYIVAGPAYHVTHRCHNQAFLLRFAKDRDAYRAMLREHLRERPELSVLTYCITSNHVHLLLTSRTTDTAVSSLMQALEGEFAGYYNRRKRRTGAFWGGRFHATMIDSGEYLWRCMRYIDLNMVRAGVVQHPGSWRWTGFGEIGGQRTRYRILDLAELHRRTDQPNLARLQKWYADWIADSAAPERAQRDDQWTQSIAVGSKPFVEHLGRHVEDRMKVEVQPAQAGGWLLRERGEPYSLDLTSKRGRKTPKSG